MKNQEIFDKVLAIVTPFCKNVESLKLANENTRFIEDLGINSARLVDIVLDFEDIFKIEIDDASADGILSMQDAVDLIIAKTTVIS